MAIVKDDDSHFYVIPVELVDDFYSSDDEDKYFEYMVGNIVGFRCWVLEKN